jgi:hypothetical protein
VRRGELGPARTLRAGDRLLQQSALNGAALRQRRDDGRRRQSRGPSLQEAVGHIPRAEFKRFTRWLYAKEAVQRWSEGKNPGISKADAEYIYNRDADTAMAAAADAVTKWNRDVLDFSWRRGASIRTSATS